jgi:hypothetical protein
VLSSAVLGLFTRLLAERVHGQSQLFNLG